MIIRFNVDIFREIVSIKVNRASVKSHLKFAKFMLKNFYD